MVRKALRGRKLIFMPKANFLLQPKFLIDAAWNSGSLIAMSVIGVVLNFFIVTYFGITELGVFNQIYAAYVVSAQFAVMGFQDSTQKHISESDTASGQLGAISVAALVLVFMSGLFTALCVYFLSGSIGLLVDSAPVGKGIAMAAPGLVFFAVNKVLMGVLNGVRRMKAFAAAQTLRVSVILISSLGIAWSGYPAYVLGFSFVIAEVVLLPALLCFVKPQSLHFSSNEALWNWIRQHFGFGTRALINGLLAQAYIRIDIIMLGIFLSDRDVGLYSFAALFVDGLYQVAIVFRTLANPELARLLKNGDKLETGRFSRRVALMSVGAFTLAAAAVLLIYPFLAPFFPSDLIALSYPVLLVLLSGLVVYSFMIPMDYIILQGGMPGRQSALMTFNVLVNAVLNLALIPFFGLYGACTATAIAFCVAALAINGASWKWLGFRGGVLLYGISHKKRGRT